MGTLALRIRTNVTYFGDKSVNQVHYLPNENDQCRIDEIIESGNSVAFFPDTLEEAQSTGWVNCPFGLGMSTDSTGPGSDR